MASNKAREIENSRKAEKSFALNNAVTFALSQKVADAPSFTLLVERELTRQGYVLMRAPQPKAKRG